MVPIEEWLARAGAHRRETGRPLVSLCYAQSLDGSIALQREQPLALSGAGSLELTHRLRAAHDAILVGIGTVLADDPSLTVRLVEGKSPQPVVLDSRLRFPLRAKLLHQHLCPPWIATLPSAGDPQAAALQAAGAQLLYLPASEQGSICLPALLECLAERGIKSLMVEGGARVITSFLSQSLVDQVALTITPRYIGGLRAVEAPLWREAEASEDENLAPRLENIVYERRGDDLTVFGRVVKV